MIEVPEIVNRLSHAVLYVRENLRLSLETAVDEIVKFVAYKFWQESRYDESLSIIDFALSFEGGFLTIPSSAFILPDQMIAFLRNMFEGVCLHAMAPKDRGRMFDAFLDRNMRGELGVFTAPRNLARFVIECLAPVSGESIFDPSHGIGDFLIEARRGVNPDSRFQVGGYELNPFASRVYAVRIFLEWPELMAKARGDMRYDTTDTLDTDKGRYNLAVCMPNETRRGGVIMAKWRSLPEFVAMERCLDALRPGGRLGLVVSDAALDRLCSAELRSEIEQRCELLFSFAVGQHELIHAGLFNPINVLIFRRIEPGAHLMSECAFASDISLPEAAAGFHEFRMHNNLW